VFSDSKIMERHSVKKQTAGIQVEGI